MKPKENVVYPLICILCALVMYAPLLAQDTETQSQTLLGSGKPLNKEALGFFVAPAYGFTQMDGSHASLFHIRGGVSYKDKFALGGFYNVSLNQIMPQSEVVPNVYMDYWSLGGFAEYTAWSKKLVHLSFPLYVGFGEVQMDNEPGELELGEAYLFLVEPSALLEVNIHKNLRFNIGTGYRIVGNMTYRNFNQGDISGFTGYVGLKFGLFD